MGLYGPYKGFNYVRVGMIWQAARGGASIKIFRDFEIEIDFDRGMIAIDQ